MKKRQGISHQLRNKWITDWEKSDSQSEHGVAFLNTQDFISRGAKSRTPDYGNPGHDRDFFSINERFYFLHLLRAANITWIKEQRPLLPLERAIAIAKQLGVKYPTYPYSSNVESVMTTDFLCGTIFGNQVVYSVKDAKELSDCKSWSKQKQKNFENKLKIDKLFWESQNIKWHLISSTSIKTTYSSNLQQLAPYLIVELKEKILLPSWLRMFSSKLLRSQNKRVSEMLQETADELEIKYSEVSSMFHHALWHKHILADLNVKLQLEKQVAVFRFEVPLNG